MLFFSATSAVVLLTLLMVFSVLFRKLSQTGSHWQPTLPAAGGAAARYAPMLRLLDETEYRFLAAHPAFGKTRARKIRAERRQIFRSYMRCLGRDYARVCASIRMVMMESGVDRPDLAKALLRNRTIFTAALVGIEFRLALHACGLGTIDVSPMIASLEGMRRTLESLAGAGAVLQPALQAG